ncbi:MAG TPA: hypothetical protein VFZ66_17460, partial [Herpetosiphonaceae bacterium]
MKRRVSSLRMLVLCVLLLCNGLPLAALAHSPSRTAEQPRAARSGSQRPGAAGAIRLVGRFEDTDIVSVAVSGSIAYLAGGSTGLRIVDVGAPDQPRLLAKLAVDAHDLEVVGGLAYLVNNTPGLVIVDVRDPSKPRVIVTHTLPGIDQRNGGLIDPMKIVVVDKLAYISGHTTGLQIIDVSNPARPRARGSYQPGRSLHDIQVVGHLAYLADSSYGLHIVDVKNPQQPRLRGQYVTSPFYPTALSVVGRYTYLGGGPIHVIDTGTPETPKLHRVYEPQGSRTGRLLVINNIAYLANRTGGLELFDVSKADSFARHAAYAQAGVTDVAVVGDLVYLVSMSKGLDILRLDSTRLGPAERRCFSETGQCISGPFLEFWKQNGGLAVFGFPVTRQRHEPTRDLGHVYPVQWFERNRFELHGAVVYPDDKPSNVILGRLSDDWLQRQGIDWRKWPQADGPRAGCLWFEQTRHNVCDQGAGLGFMTYWQTHGINDPELPSYQQSLALFGLPLSEPRLETNS